MRIKLNYNEQSSYFKQLLKVSQLLIVICLVLTSCVVEPSQDYIEVFGKEVFDGYTQIHVDGGDLSGDREANVVVDIGFGEREYFAFTNQYGQLVKVIAKEIILQDDETEDVLSSGRYYSDEAKVPGVESKTLDEGHVIADSLGGVSNAYNITPQESTLNRHGDQAYMEDAIRKAGGASNFIALISYPNTETQIPSHYSMTYTLKGKVVHDEFDNRNPDAFNKTILQESDIQIIQLDKKEEFVVVKNIGKDVININGWKIVSVRGDQFFTFDNIKLSPGESIKIGDEGRNSDVDMHWMDGGGVWNNSKSDPAELYNKENELVFLWQD